MTKYKVFSYDREEKSMRKEREREVGGKCLFGSLAKCVCSHKRVGRLFKDIRNTLPGAFS